MFGWKSGRGTPISQRVVEKVDRGDGLWHHEFDNLNNFLVVRAWQCQTLSETLHLIKPMFLSRSFSRSLRQASAIKGRRASFD